jgi:hypothetical protein
MAEGFQACGYINVVKAITMQQIKTKSFYILIKGTFNFPLAR